MSGRLVELHDDAIVIKSNNDCHIFDASSVTHVEIRTKPHLASSNSILSKAEQELILRTLEACGGNRTHAANKLGISRRTLLYKLKKLNQGKLQS